MIFPDLPSENDFSTVHSQLHHLVVRLTLHIFLSADVASLFCKIAYTLLYKFRYILKKVSGVIC